MPAKNQINYRAEMEKPEFSATLHKLRAQIVPTRPLLIIASELKLLQQQVAAGLDGDSFWSGDNKLPVKGAVFVGESGSGKSHGLRYGLQSLPAIDLADGGSMPSKPLFVDTPSQGTVATLCKEVIRCADGVEMREPKDHEAPGKAIRALARHKFTLVAIDEVSRILNPQRHVGRGLAVQSQLVWTLGVETLNLSSFPTPIVFAGLNGLVDSLTIQDKKEEAKKVRREAQRRFNIVRLPDLSLDRDGDMLERAILTYCAMAGVEIMFTEDDLIVPRLIHASYGQAGTALQIVQQAVALAKVRARGKLNIDDFAAVYERMTSAVRGANPFVIEEWDRIDIGIVAPRSKADAMIKEGRSK